MGVVVGQVKFPICMLLSCDGSAWCMVCVCVCVCVCACVYVYVCVFCVCMLSTWLHSDGDTVRYLEEVPIDCIPAFKSKLHTIL